MIPAAAGYDVAARSTQQVGYSCDLVAWDLSSTVIAGLPISGGSLKVGRGSVRRTGSVQIVTDGGLAPPPPRPPLHPYGHHYLRLRATVVAEAGTFVLPLGTLRVADLDAEVTPGGSVLTATVTDDAAEAVRGRTWPGVAWVQDRPAETLEARVAATLAACYAPARFVSTATGVSVPAGQIVLGPKVKTYPDLVALVEGYGWVLGVDVDGVYRLSAPVTATALAFGGTGARTATVVRTSWSMKDLVNSSSFLVNSAEQGSAQGLAYDTSDPLIAPTTSGRWGQVWTCEESRDVAASAVGAAAAAQLVGTAGGSRKVTFKAVPDYRLEGGDKVALNLADQKVAGTFVVDTVSYSLAPGALMDVTCLEVRGG